jgi:hypothetical protein
MMPGQQISVSVSQTKSTLRVNEMLREGERLTSPNGKYYAEMQVDNNFVVYSSSPVNALWATNTS